MDEDLVDHQKNCRFCLGKITRFSVHITEEIRQGFFTLTNSKLKTTENYSSVICVSCLKDLESSVEFQQRIIINQQRLQNFESSTNVPEKEESLQTEALDIKAEFIEFEPAAVIQSWQELPKEDSIEPDQDEESPAEALQDDFSENSDSMLITEAMLPETRPPKKTSKKNERHVPFDHDNVPQESHVFDKAFVRVNHEESSDFSSKLNIASTKPTKNSQGKFECKLCDTSLNTKKSLKVHMSSIHMGIRRFQCKNCSKKFYHKQAMLYHTKKNVCKKEKKNAKKKILIKGENV